MCTTFSTEASGEGEAQLHQRVAVPDSAAAANDRWPDVGQKCLSAILQKHELRHHRSDCHLIRNSHDNISPRIWKMICNFCSLLLVDFQSCAFPSREMQWLIHLFQWTSSLNLQSAHWLSHHIPVAMFLLCLFSQSVNDTDSFCLSQVTVNRMIYFSGSNSSDTEEQPVMRTETTSHIIS